MANSDRRWSVVIPSDRIESLEKSVPSILASHPTMSPESVVVVSKGITLGQIRERIGNVTFIHDPSPFCFSRRINLAVSALAEKDVVIMGDDVQVITEGAFDKMALEAPLRLLAAAVRGRVGPWWQRADEGDPPRAEVPFISFTCVYVPRTVYNIVGPLEEGFSGYGYDDTDYCLRARRAGLSCGVSAAIVEHTLQIPSTFIEFHGANLSAMEEEAKRMFEAKWKRRLT